MGSLLLLAATTSHAAFAIEDAPPQSYDDIREVLREKIPEELEKAQCGGLRSDLHVGSEPGRGGMIPRVTGVPGRAADPLGNLYSGMARRVEEGEYLDDGFSFPPSADGSKGFATACEPGETVVQRHVWAPLDRRVRGEYELQEFDNPPYFEDPPCLWSPDGKGEGPMTPMRCKEFCDWVNEIRYRDCQVFQRTKDGTGWKCVAVGWKYLCSEQWKTSPEEADVIPEETDDERSSSSSSSSDGDDASSEASSEESSESSEPWDEPYEEPEEEPEEEIPEKEPPEIPDIIDPILEDPDPYPWTPDEGYPLDTPFEQPDGDIPWDYPLDTPPEDLPWLNPVENPDPPIEVPEEIIPILDDTKPWPADEFSPILDPPEPWDVWESEKLKGWCCITAGQACVAFPMDTACLGNGGLFFDYTESSCAKMCIQLQPPPPVEPPPPQPIELFNPIMIPDQQQMPAAPDMRSLQGMRPAFRAQLMEEMQEEVIGTVSMETGGNDEGFQTIEEVNPYATNESVTGDNNEGWQDDDGEAEEDKKDDAGDESSDGADRPRPFVRSDDDHIPNCMRCVGDACRCPGPGCYRLEGRANGDDPLPTAARAEKTFYSFEREYRAHAERGIVPDAPDDALADAALDVACYGFYEEFDAKLRRTSGEADIENPGNRARRCVIGFPYDFAELQQTQSVAHLGPSEAEDGVLPVRESDDRDLWRPIMGGMSFYREPRSDGNTVLFDLGSAFLQPDTARMTAIHQRTEDEPDALRGNQRATDDTVSNETGDSRHFTTYIQRLQQEMATLLTPPSVRLRIPAAWTGILERLPRAPGSETTNEGEPDSDPRNKSIDVQLYAEDDLAGKLIAAVQQFFSIREEVVPAVIPLGSPMEFRARAMQWRNRVRQWENGGVGYPSEVWLLIGKLDEYATQIESFRRLRAELTETTAAILGNDARSSFAITDWMNENAKRYERYLQERKERLALAPLVHGIQRAMTEFSDAINLPFCRNELLTVPVYSLLHTWYPGSPGLRPAMSCDDEDPDALPLLCLPEENDLIFDLTLLSVRTAPLVIPVLHPVQVMLTIPPVPGDGDEPPDAVAMSLPDLPPLPEIDIAQMQEIQRIAVQSEPPLIKPPATIDLVDVQNSLRQALAIFEGRNRSYAEFWESIRSDDPPEIRANSDGDDLSDAEHLACEEWNVYPCIHVEMDLQERIARMTARPGMLLQEDLQIQGYGRAAEVGLQENTIPGVQASEHCDPADHLCTPPLRRTVSPPAEGWQVIPPSTDTDVSGPLERIRTTVRRLTITDDAVLTPDPGTGLPLPYAEGAGSLMPAYSVPKDIDLLPPENQ